MGTLFRHLNLKLPGSKHWRSGKSVVVLAHLFLWCFPSYGNDSVELLINTDFPPYIDDVSLNGGIFTDLVRSSYERVGVDLKLKVMPWKRALRSVQLGRAAGTYSWGRNAERDANLLVSSPLFVMSDVLFTRLGNVATKRQLLAQLPKDGMSSICVPLGWTVAEVFRPLIDGKRMLRTSPESINSCLESVYLGRVDVTYMPRFSVGAAIADIRKRMPMDAVRPEAVQRIDNVDYIRNTTHALFSQTARGHKYLRLFEAGLVALKADGSYARIVEKHLALHPDVDAGAVFRDLTETGILTSD